MEVTPEALLILKTFGMKVLIKALIKVVKY